MLLGEEQRTNHIGGKQMECPECFATIPDMAKYCPECGKKLTISGSTAKIEDSVVTRSPGAGSNYSVTAKYRQGKRGQRNG